MKTMILAALSVISLSVRAANAQPMTHGSPAHQQVGGQYNWLAGGD
jgi:hypothetical protein